MEGPLVANGYKGAQKGNEVDEGDLNSSARMPVQRKRGERKKKGVRKRLVERLNAELLYM